MGNSMDNGGLRFPIVEERMTKDKDGSKEKSKKDKGRANKGK